MYYNKYDDGKLTSIKDGSEWTLGEWRTIDGDVTLRPCINGFHMSDTYRDTQNFVSGTALAFVEARGDFVDNAAEYNNGRATKSVSREMRVLAFWRSTSIPYTSESDHASALDSAFYGRAVITEIDDAYYTACNDISDAYYAARKPLDDAFDEVARPYTATMERDQGNAAFTRSQAKDAAQAAYNRAIDAADNAYAKAVNDAQYACEDALRPFEGVRKLSLVTLDGKRDADLAVAREAYDIAIADARVKAAENVQPAKDAYTAAMLTGLGKPVSAHTDASAS
jgi:hypothetical protein